MWFGRPSCSIRSKRLRPACGAPSRPRRRPWIVQLTSAGVRNAAEIEHAIEAFGRARNGGLIVLPSPPTIVHRALIVSLAARYELPAVYAFRHFVGEGGLMSYGISLPDQYRQAASYVNRILRGERPADLPIQQPTKFEPVIST